MSSRYRRLPAIGSSPSPPPAAQPKRRKRKKTYSAKPRQYSGIPSLYKEEQSDCAMPSSAIGILPPTVFKGGLPANIPTGKKKKKLKPVIDFARAYAYACAIFFLSGGDSEEFTKAFSIALKAMTKIKKPFVGHTSYREKRLDPGDEEEEKKNDENKFPNRRILDELKLKFMGSSDEESESDSDEVSVVNNDNAASDGEGSDKEKEMEDKENKEQKNRKQQLKDQENKEKEAEIKETELKLQNVVDCSYQIVH